MNDLSNKKYLFVDDEREPPASRAEQTIIARNYREAITWLTMHKFDQVSLDHDIASYENDGSRRERTGYDIALWLANRKFNDLGYVPPIVTCHSMNPIGKSRIDGVISRYLS